MSRQRMARIVLVVIVLFVVGVTSLFAFLALTANRQTARRAQTQAFIEAEQMRRHEAELAAASVEAPVTFSNPQPPTPDVIAELLPLLQQLGASLERRDAEAVAEFFDSSRIMSEFERIGVFDQMPPHMRNSIQKEMQRGMKEDFGRALVANEFLRWFQTDIHHVRWSPNRDEVVVIAFHESKANPNVPMRIRWWFIQRPDGWKIYDFEDMHLGLRSTRNIAAMLTPEMAQQQARKPQQFQAAFRAIRTTIALLAKGDIEGGDKALALARGLPWPKPMQAIVELAEGMILLGRGDAVGAVARFETVDQLSPAMPNVSILRARAYITLGRPVEAIEAIRAYQREVGPDALSYSLEGSALEAQGKKAEAANVYRLSLDRFAESTEVFDGLRRVLPNEQKKELGDRLARLKDPRRIYDVLAQLAFVDGDEVGESALLDGLLKARPDDAHTQGEVLCQLVKQKKFTEANPVLKRGLAAKTREDRELVLNAYLFAMLVADKSLDAYTATPAEFADHAFRTLAEGLEGNPYDKRPEPEQSAKQLKELVAAHRKRSPDDLWVCFFDGVVLQNAKEYEKAEKMFAAGAAKLKLRQSESPDEPNTRERDADRFRSRRVQCLFKLKKGLEAYRGIGPAKDTFQQLAGLYDMEQDLTGLSALIVVHQKSDIRDPERMYWQAHLLYRKGEYTGAAPVFEKYLSDSDGKELNRWNAQNELVRSLLRSKATDAAKKIADLGPDKVNLALRAATAAAINNYDELEHLLVQSAKNGGKTWFYMDEDFRRFIYQDKYRDLRMKYPDPNPPLKQEG